MADDDEKGYTWETEYERTWEALQEDAEGSLRSSVDDIIHRAKRRKLMQRPANVRLGMMRHLFLILDISESMKDQDLKPTRLMCTIKLLEHFIDEYFDQNPISQLGIMVMRNKRAEKITELGGNPKRHVEKLKSLHADTPSGEPSMQNALELSLQTLRHMPSHASREVLMIMASLTTCDPGDITETVDTLKKENVQCSIIGLAAEVRICKQVALQTRGKYNVILDESHFKDILHQHTSPPPASASSESSLIRMGFPHHQLHTDHGGEKPSFCMCHLDSKTGLKLSTSGYFCPQCKSKYCELPVECKACGLTLVSAPHLARSYHHLFPLDVFKEIPAAEIPLSFKCCFGCQKEKTEQPLYSCSKCEQLFCVDCDVFVHDVLHSCPGCASSRSIQLMPTPIVAVS